MKEPKKIPYIVTGDEDGVNLIAGLLSADDIYYEVSVPVGDEDLGFGLLATVLDSLGYEGGWTYRVDTLRNVDPFNLPKPR